MTINQSVQQILQACKFKVNTPLSCPWSSIRNIAVQIQKWAS